MMLVTLALAAALQAAALPAQEDVRQALADQLASRCGDDDACIARQPATQVRALSCQPDGEDLASCRYETRTGSAPWRPAETRFRFDIETQLWFADEGERG
ncbi:hypothetical protein [Allosphingosinicella sp.]|jgi:hypothetical protein|uniref:hypothetical protein n=1 Tax=Allosphingosinicella sp. TaxID=2823234 RepID=UPI002EF9FEA6